MTRRIFMTRRVFMTRRIIGEPSSTPYGNTDIPTLNLSA
jgi:hypothetical protein